MLNISATNEFSSLRAKRSNPFFKIVIKWIASVASFLAMAASLFILMGCASNQSTAAEATKPTLQSSLAEEQFITRMVNKHGFDRAQLETTFSQIKRQPKIIITMDTPHEAKPWYEYRKTFLKPERVKAGVKYWRKNAKNLAAAEQKYGVPAHIIVGILGVETSYGQNTGNHRVIDVLATLAFDYPRRAKFFSAELEQFLLLSREQGWDPLSIKGSYAGAIGKPQFMPSSYRRYGVSYNGKIPVNLMTNDVDIIFSVANYLKQNGWQPNQPIATKAKITGTHYQSVPDRELTPKFTIAQLKQRGITPERPVSGAAKAALLKLEGAAVPEFWLGLYDFYVLSRYNPRINYTMVVYQLAEKIRIMHGQRIKTTEGDNMR